MKIKDIKGKYICDECSQTFKGSSIKLVEAADNIKILTPLMYFLFVDKEGIIKGSSEQAVKTKGDMLLTCPLCECIHLYGFNRVV